MRAGLRCPHCGKKLGDALEGDGLVRFKSPCPRCDHYFVIEWLNGHQVRAESWPLFQIPGESTTLLTRT